MEGDLATGEVDRAGLSTYLHTYDLRKLYVVVHILTHSLPILPELSLRPEAEHVAPLLEDYQNHHYLLPLGSPLLQGLGALPVHYPLPSNLKLPELPRLPLMHEYRDHVHLNARKNP